jgi:hypothetical protein
MRIESNLSFNQSALELKVEWESERGRIQRSQDGYHFIRVARIFAR